jgi:guanine deaminase
MADHEYFLRQAIAEALAGVAANRGGPFGAVVVKDGQIIGRGCNNVTSLNDPTAHAEVQALRDAGANLQDFRLSGCTLYASCQPCPMCQAAAYWARVDAVFYASSGRDAAELGFDDEWVRREISLPADQRHTPLTQLLPIEGLEPFHAWRAKTDKTWY